MSKCSFMRLLSTKDPMCVIMFIPCALQRNVEHEDHAHFYFYLVFGTAKREIIVVFLK